MVMPNEIAPPPHKDGFPRRGLGRCSTDIHGDDGDDTVSMMATIKDSYSIIQSCMVGHW